MQKRSRCDYKSYVDAATAVRRLVFFYEQIHTDAHIANVASDFSPLAAKLQEATTLLETFSKLVHCESHDNYKNIIYVNYL